MNMVMIVYNEAIGMEVMEVLDNCGTENYTKITEVFGKGATSGTHLGTDVWPGRNNLLYVACDEAKGVELLTGIRELRRKLGREGVKAFIWPLQDLT